MSKHQAELQKSFSILNSLRKSLPEGSTISGKYIDMYHEEIDRLSQLGIPGLEDFKIPQNQIKREVLGGNYVKEEVEYGSDVYTEKAYLLTKLEALLTFFQLEAADQKIGFNLQA